MARKIQKLNKLNILCVSNKQQTAFDGSLELVFAHAHWIFILVNQVVACLLLSNIAIFIELAEDRDRESHL